MSKLSMLFIAILSLSGCSQLQKVTINDSFVLPKDNLSDNEGGVFSSTKKNTLSSKTIGNLNYAQSKLSKTSNIDFDYMILDTDGYSYTVVTKDDTPYVAFSTTYLDEFGEDQDVIVSSTAHTLAHIKNNDTDSTSEIREASMFVVRQVVSTVVSIFATPIAGYASSTALSGAEAGIKVINENKANEDGLNIVIESGLSPCGFIKEKLYADKNIGITNPKKYLAAHSGIDKRAEITQEYLKKHPEIHCGEHAEKEKTNESSEEVHEPLMEADSR